MSTDTTKRKMAAILSADVKGYSRLMSSDEEGTVKALNDCRKIIATCVHDHKGRIVDSPGDNVLAEFASTVEAVKCAVKIQENLKIRNADLPESQRMEFRVGVNLGDVIEEEGRIYGDGVNIAARLEGLAEAGGICISGTAFDQVKTKIPVGYQYLGKQTVKNIPDPVRAYKVLLEPESAGKVIGETEPKQRTWGWKSVAAAALLVLVAGGLIWNFYWPAPKIEPASKEKMAFPLPDKPSIAVLPFDNISGDREQDYLADGITENIISYLSKIPELFVIDRKSASIYKGKPVRVQQVSEDLGVRYILEGSVQKSGNKLRVTAQLIDALKGHPLWSERYDRDFQDLFALQDEITLNILKAMQVQLTRGEIARRHDTANIEAWSYAVRGFSLAEQLKKEAVFEARNLYEKALNLDPSYGYVWDLLAWTYILEAWLGWTDTPADSLRRALELAQKGEATGKVGASFHTTMNMIYMLKGKYDEAIAEGEKAIAMEPNAAGHYFWLARVLRYAGRPNETIANVNKAMRLHPYYPAYYLLDLGGAYDMGGQYSEALATWNKLLERSLKGEFFPLFAHEWLAITYGRLGQPEKARAHVDEILKINPKYAAESFRKSTPYKDRAYLDGLVSLLVKAGLPDKPPLPLPDKPSIAVLPFVNMSDDKSQEYFSDGLTEEIITALSKTPKLFVIARNSSFIYKGKPVNVQQVSRELGVKYVLEGSVRRSGEQLRITAQLIDATTGNHLWAERYDREMKDVFIIQDEVTMKILTSLQVTLTEGESARSFERGTDSLEAYLKTIEGRELMFALNKDDNALARRKFDEAIALDPNFARAYAALSLAYTLDFMYRVDPMESLRRAYEFAQKAIALDEGQLLAHGALEFVYGWKRQHEMAIAAGERAVQIAPGCADAYFYLGRALNFACRDEEAVSQLEKAIRMNPFPPGPYYMHLGMSYLSLRQYEKAVTVLKKCINLNPKNISGRRMLTVTYVEMGRLEEARVEAEEILKIDPKFTSRGFEKIVPFKDAEITKRYIEGLRAAGLERDVSAN